MKITEVQKHHIAIIDRHENVLDVFTDTEQAKAKWDEMLMGHWGLIQYVLKGIDDKWYRHT